MPLQNVAFTDIFDTNRIRINQMVVVLNNLTDGAQNLTNVVSVTANNAVVGGINVGSTLSNSFDRANTTAYQLTFMSPSVGLIPILGSVPSNGSIISANCFTDAGFCNVSIKINSVNVTSATGINASSTPATTTPTGANTIFTANSVWANVHSVTGSPRYLNITLKILKTT